MCQDRYAPVLKVYHNQAERSGYPANEDDSTSSDSEDDDSNNDGEDAEPEAKACRRVVHLVNSPGIERRMANLRNEAANAHDEDNRAFERSLVREHAISARRERAARRYSARR